MSRPERFERIYAEHYDAVWRYAMRRVGGERAADVAHETFLVLWRRLEDAPAAPRPWLIGVARNVVLHDRRSHARRERLAARVAAEPVASPAEAPELDDALAFLSTEDRDLLGLVYWDDLTPAEAATAIGCSPATLRVRLHRARGRLAALLADVREPSLEEAS
ncbi:MAG: sigma-70 family RNA polymerase sigma factor [Solirubrobacteraceae bacterium]